MEKKVEKFIRENHLFTKDEPVFVGCSGGPDSICLLEILHRLSYRVTAVYVHHGLRENANKEEAFVSEFCKERKIPFISRHVHVMARVKKTHETVEEAARILRYEALESVWFSETDESQFRYPEGDLRQHKAGKIALAHHKDDQAETVLFQMIRGSHLTGLSGMPVSRDFYVRPLLAVTKKEIEQWLSCEKIPYCLDESNETDEMTRNRIRHHVLPALTEIRSDAVTKISDSADTIREVDAYMREKAAEFLSQNAAKTENGYFISSASFSKEKRVMQDYITEEAFRLAGFLMKDKTRKHIESVRELFKKPVGRQIRLKKEEYAIRTYDGVNLRKSKPGDATWPKEEAADPEGIFSVKEYAMDPSVRIFHRKFTKQFDRDKIRNALVLRKRKAGDMIATAVGVHKKLGDYFIDEKIPKDERGNVSVFADGQNIVWVVGYRISEEYKVTKNTKTVMEITFHDRRIRSTDFSNTQKEKGQNNENS